MGTNGKELAVMQRGSVARDEFGGNQIQLNAETALAAVSARERAIIEAQFLMAERHPRNWMDVRTQMLEHCSRPRFAEISRYSKPVGRAKINGEWVDQKATGFTVRFAETLAQEMMNVKPEAAVTFEDDLIRIIRFSVTDLQRNLPRSREVTVAKAVEKRGKKSKDGTWEPPAGREVISQRLNSYGEPTYLCKATDDEIRAKINSEESKTQRDFILKLCPRDILEDCEERIADALAKEDKRDPLLAMKRVVDGFAGLGIHPSDLETYLGKTLKQITEADRSQLRDLYSAIRDNQITFDEALRLKFSTGEESEADRDIRHQRQMDQQRPDRDEAADKRIAELREQEARLLAERKQKAEVRHEPEPSQEEKDEAQLRAQLAYEQQKEKEAERARPKRGFGA